MSNFITTLKKGQEGKNTGFSTGLPLLDVAIKKLKKNMIIGVAAAPKCGKTTFADFAYVISPYLDALSKGLLDKIEWIYHSYEVTRIEKEFKFAAFFMAYDHGIYNFTYKGVLYLMDDDYLMGQAIHKNEDGSTEMIPMFPEHKELLKIIYFNRIVPLFGEWSEEGERITQNEDGTPKPKPKITIIEEADNPTGLYKYLLNYAGQNGSFKTEKYATLADDGKSTIVKERIISYVPKDPEKLTIVVTDHVRALKLERGFTLKQNIDKFMEYSRIIKKLCGFTFIHIIHSNRNLANVERLKYAGEWIYPTSDDVKDSGNPAEDCTTFMTLFNPGDEKYNIQKHMGAELAKYPFYRSVHITEQRRGKCPVHIQLNMYGGINMFTPLV